MANEEHSIPPAPVSARNSPSEKSTIDPNDLPAGLLSNLRIAIPGYALIREIDRGGQAVVYKAVANADGKAVAIKILLDGVFASAAARQRFEREIIALRALKHPNIVRILNSGQSPDGHDYIVMDYIEGRPFKDFIVARNHGLVPADFDQFLLNLFRKICGAMAAVHRAGITHRDLCPSNILVDDRDEPRIIDFGLSRTEFDSLFPGRHDISMTGQFMGKLQYASPEQARASKGAADIRADVYSLGVILYRIVTGGRFPYEVDGTLDQVVYSILHSLPTPPSTASRSPETKTDAHPHPKTPNQAAPAVDAAMDAIVLRALEKEPGDRYQSAGELERAIADYLAAMPSRTPAQTHSPGRRRILLPAAMCGALLVIGGIAWRTMRPKHPAELPLPAAQAVANDAVALPPTAPPLPRITFGTPEIHGGHWSVEGEELVQSDLNDPNATIIFGDPAWSDYDLNFKAIAISTNESNGFKALVHRTDDGNFSVLSIGNSNGVSFELSQCIAGLPQTDSAIHLAGEIRFGHAYDVRIEVRQSDLRFLLDGEELFHKHDEALGKGCVGLATFQSACRFREIRVTDVDGHILWNGPPPVMTPSENPGP